MWRFLVALAVIIPLAAWMMTVEVGILHSWWHLMPPMPAHTAFALVSFITIIGGGLKFLATLLFGAD